MKYKISIIALTTLLSACGGKGAQTGNADTMQQESVEAPENQATPEEATSRDTLKSLTPDSQMKPAHEGSELYGPKKAGGG